MKYSENLFSTLEFDKIKALLAECSMTEGAGAKALMLEPTSDPVVIVRRQNRTTDALRLANAKGMPTFINIRDVGATCERADKGAVLSMRELLDVAAVLRSARMLIDYINGNKLFAQTRFVKTGRTGCPLPLPASRSRRDSRSRPPLPRTPRKKARPISPSA